MFFYPSLMGATGNLAQKYLWQSLRNIEASGASLMIWPAATRPNVQKLIDTILADNVTYPHGDQDKERFLKVVGPYHRLTITEDYQLLNKAIEQHNQGLREVGRFVYLSVPPKFFGAISKEINLHLRPKDEKTWLKVIVEKPFGVDLNSALQLSRDLFSNLKEEEVLCVDHYMGKDGLHGIRDFRNANKDYISHSFRLRDNYLEIEYKRSMIITPNEKTLFFQSSQSCSPRVIDHHLLLDINIGRSPRFPFAHAFF